MPRVQLLPGNYIMQQFLQALAAASARRGYSMVIVVPDGDPRDEMRRLIASRSVDAFLLSELQPDDPRVLLLAEAGYARSPASAGPVRRCRSTGSTSTTARPVAAAVEPRARPRVLPGSPSWATGRRTTGTPSGRPGSGPGWPNAGFPPSQAEHAAGGRRQRPHGRSGRCWPPGACPACGPDAIVTSSDRLAAVVYSVAAELRLRIGQDLAVTGFDGSSAAGLMHPQLTTVSDPGRRDRPARGGPGARQLDHGPDQEPGEVVPARLQLGESTGEGWSPGRSGRWPAGPAGARDGAAEAGEDAVPSWKRFQGAALADRHAAGGQRGPAGDDRGRGRRRRGGGRHGLARPQRQRPGAGVHAARRCSTRSTGSATGPATPPPPWSGARRVPWRSSSPT